MLDLLQELLENTATSDESGNTPTARIARLCAWDRKAYRTRERLHLCDKNLNCFGRNNTRKEAVQIPSLP